MSALEKAARAAYDVDGGIPEEWDSAEPYCVQVRSEYIAQARAVLMAVRGVDRDAQSAATVDGWLEVEGGFETMWHSYIDAILNEEPK